MTIAPGCLLETDAPGPPDDPVSIFQPTGWCHFWTAHADAWIFPAGDEFLLHWIESNRRGDGSILLAGISAWADMKHVSGKLTCEATLAPFYERYRWAVTRPFGLPGFVEMRREHR